jgi:predicted unusual protein kinase regulating ubiquinone biosynthesis (AarF/ABC1/UbiB family)
MYEAGLNYADPHSGNYVFMADGRLGLLDFGCLQRWDATELQILKACEGLLNDPKLLPEVLRVAGADEKHLSNPEYIALMRESCNWIMEPLAVNGPFNFGQAEHLRRGIDIISRITLKRYTRSHPMFIYWNRSLIGIRALMYQLAAQVDVEIFAIRVDHSAVPAGPPRGRRDPARGR